MNFTGTAQEIAFKVRLDRVLRKNEIGNLTEYALYYAGVSTSGWSFGVPQFDLGQQNTRVVEYLAKVLLEARKPDGTYLIDDNNSATDRGSPKKPEDTVVIGLLAKAQQKGGAGLSPIERALVTQALDSSEGRAAVDKLTDQRRVTHR
jgi:hypothetical protein